MALVFFALGLIGLVALTACSLGFAWLGTFQAWDYFRRRGWGNVRSRGLAIAVGVALAWGLWLPYSVWWLYVAVRHSRPLGAPNWSHALLVGRWILFIVGSPIAAFALLYGFAVAFDFSLPNIAVAVTIVMPAFLAWFAYWWRARRAHRRLPFRQSP